MARAALRRRLHLLRPEFGVSRLRLAYARWADLRLMRACVNELVRDGLLLSDEVDAVMSRCASDDTFIATCLGSGLLEWHSQGHGQGLPEGARWTTVAVNLVSNGGADIEANTPVIICAAALSPDTPPFVFTLMADARWQSVRLLRAVAYNPMTPPAVMDNFADSDDFDFRRMAWFHPRTSEVVRATLYEEFADEPSAGPTHWAGY